VYEKVFHDHHFCVTFSLNAFPDSSKQSMRKRERENDLAVLHTHSFRKIFFKYNYNYHRPFNFVTVEMPPYLYIKGQSSYLIYWTVCGKSVFLPKISFLNLIVQS
jgi:hypothetical protein